MQSFLLAYSAWGFLATLVVSACFMFVGPSEDHWLYRPWLLKRNPVQWWVASLCVAVGLAFLLPPNPRLLFIPVLAFLMALAVLVGAKFRWAIWVAAVVILLAILLPLASQQPA